MKSGKRRLGRILAMKLLFGLPHQECQLREVFDDFWRNFAFAEDELGDALDEDMRLLPAPARHFAEELVSGVLKNRERIDAIIEGSAANWALDRMALVDIGILRVATYELIYCPETPARVAINEAIEIGKRFGSKETPAFVNGILDRIAQQFREREK